MNTEEQFEPKFFSIGSADYKRGLMERQKGGRGDGRETQSFISSIYSLPN
jgi:hypothetical protein